MDNTKNERYQVIIFNQIAKGFATEQVIDNLAELFKKDKSIIEKMLCKQSYIVKSDINNEQAKIIHQRIKKTGVGCLIKPIKEVSSNTVLSQPVNSQIICPKCKTQQNVSDICVNCGVVYAKYNQSPNEIASNVIKPTDSNLYQSRANSSEKTRSTWSKNKLLVAMVSIISIGILFTNLHGFDKKIIDPAKVGIKTFQIEDVRFADDLAEPGYITAVIFVADWCDSCEKHKKTESLAMRRHPDMAVRRIDISRKNGFQIAQEKYKLPIYHVPFTIIYDDDGSVIEEDKSKFKHRDYYAGTNYFRNKFANK